MIFNENLLTWGTMDVSLIEKAYKQTKSEILFELCSSSTMDKIEKSLKSQLPDDYIVKCDLELNPNNIIESGNILARIYRKTNVNNSYNYIDIIFNYETISRFTAKHTR